MQSTRTHLNIAPKTRSGRWSVRLGIAFMLMFAANIPFNIYVMQPIHGPNPPAYVAFILVMLVCGIIAGSLGLAAVLKYRERSLLVWLSTITGIFALLIFLNESLQGLQYLLRR